MERMAFRAQTIVADVVLAACAFALAYAAAPMKLSAFGLAGLPSLTLIQLVVLYAALAGGFTVLFRRELSPWRYVSIPDVLVLARIAFLTAGVFLLWVFVLDRARGLPRATLFVAPLVQMMFSMGVRVARRALHERAFQSFAPLKTISDRVTGAPPLLLIGPASLADTYLRDVSRSHDRNFTPVGIVGTEARDVGQQVRGVCIIDHLDNLDAALADLRRWNRYPRAVLFLEEPARLKGLTADQLGRLKHDGVRLLRLPSIVELAHDDGVNLVPMREINIEELLAREPIELDRHAVGALIRGRRVLVTGAGGSIGSELCRQVAAFNCAHLSLLDFSETALFEIEREIGEHYPDISCTAALCDVRKAERVNAVFEREQPDLVFHAAALKHVLMVERHPCEGVLTNVIGTWNVAEAAKGCGAAQMVLISSDKAVDPANAMGATKRLAEAVVQAQQSSNGTRFAAVRFGNVLGSAGSVVPIFKSQIERGGPVTVTHPEMARYFMTIPEAAQLVLHATATSADGEAGAAARLFILEMGEPVRIMDLARQMIALSGRTPGKDINIDIIGLRTGEKLSEALLDESERAEPCAPKVLEVVSPSPLRITAAHLADLEILAESGDAEGVRRAVFDLVAQIRGERSGPAPTLRVVVGG
ncbi:MAG: capsule biosynthesis protein CapD [Phenylobacterium sp.]|jgi:O-antigen biosynthesis protein WbqV|nr:capsule biosynthesis protein CapD [Phenylobacterium sp.]